MEALTIEKIDQAWEELHKRMNNLEQHMMAAALVWDVKMKMYYDDLHKHWDTQHAELFMKAIQSFYNFTGV